jgi:hypothetical protein
VQLKEIIAFFVFIKKLILTRFSSKSSSPTFAAVFLVHTKKLDRKAKLFELLPKGGNFIPWGIFEKAKET